MNDLDLWNAISNGVSNASKHSDHGDVVDAILEQVEMELSKCEPLYRDAPYCDAFPDGRHIWSPDLDCCATTRALAVVQVWPEENNDEV